MTTVTGVARRLWDYVRPVPDEELRDLREHTLDGIRTVAICLAILAPCGITYSLTEMSNVVWGRQVIVLPLHLAYYALIAFLARRDFGRRHASLLLTMLALGISADMTIGMAWITVGYTVFILANLTPLFIAMFVPWRPLLTLALAALPIGGILGTHVMLGIPFSYPTKGVIASGLSLGVSSALAIQGQRRLWSRFERARKLLAQAELDATAQSAEASRRATDIRRILDNVGDGFMRLGLDGVMSDERSAVLSRWFGPAAAGTPFVDCLRRSGVSEADQFQMGWEQLAADILPLDVAIEQLPKRMVAGPTTFSVRYHPMLEGDALQEVIVVISDITAEVERERAESELRDLVGAIKSTWKDRDAFTEFVREAGTLVDAITTGDLARPVLLRQIHTLKGNAALFELASVASLCHDIETRMRGGEGGLQEADRARLIEVWRPITKLVKFERDDSDRAAKLEVDDSERAAVMRLLSEEAPHAEIAAEIRSWSLEPSRRRLVGLAERATATAARLDKKLEVVVEHGGVRLPHAEWSAFWAALVHLVRNALDHGIERPNERLEVGKAEAGTLRLRTAVEDDSIVVEIADDGRGIDWEAIRAKASERGMPHTTHEELEEALFADGISSRQEVTTHSGRGVGLSALRQECATLGGVIAIDSARGRGTRFTMRFPRPVSAPEESAAGPGRRRAPSESKRSQIRRVPEETAPLRGPAGFAPNRPLDCSTTRKQSPVRGRS